MKYFGVYWKLLTYIPINVMLLLIRLRKCSGSKHITAEETPKIVGSRAAVAPARLNSLNIPEVRIRALGLRFRETGELPGAGPLATTGISWRRVMRLLSIARSLPKELNAKTASGKSVPGAKGEQLV